MSADFAIEPVGFRPFVGRQRGGDFFPAGPQSGIELFEEILLHFGPLVLAGLKLRTARPRELRFRQCGQPWTRKRAAPPLAGGTWQPQRSPNSTGLLI